jgi:hypothetical protein
MGYQKAFRSRFILGTGKKISKLSNLKFLIVKRTTIFKAQEIAEKYRLKPRDDTNAAAAIENKVSMI